MKKLINYTLSAILGIGISYNANALTFDLTDEFSGGQQPTGFVRVEITDTTLTITSFLDGTEFLGDLFLNFNEAKDVSALVFTEDTSLTLGSFTDPIITTDAPPPLNADGGGTFDIRFTFDTSDGTSTRFDTTDSITYVISGISGLVAADFDFLSEDPSGGNGFFKAAAHIQGVGPDGEGSGFVGPGVPGVPDGGTTMMLLGTALACLGALRRRFA
jgi:VPDSG-CTERM motif